MLKSLIGFTILVFVVLSCEEDAQVNSSLTIENSPSQIELNLDAEQNYLKTKTELDSLLLSIEAKYKQESEVIGLLDESQKAWLVYRDAQVLMKYPKSDPIREGSAFNTCYFLYLTDLIEQRLELLKPWLTGGHNGDVCSGTVK